MAPASGEVMREPEVSLIGAVPALAVPARTDGLMPAVNGIVCIVVVVFLHQELAENVAPRAVVGVNYWEALGSGH